MLEYFAGAVLVLLSMLVWGVWNALDAKAKELNARAAQILHHAGLIEWEEK